MTNRQEVILNNLPLAEIIASQIYNRICGRMEYEDLLSYAIIGLIDAVDKFKPTICASFSTYAGKRIKGHVLDELRRLDILSRKQRKEVKEGIREDVVLCNYDSFYNIGVPFDLIEDKIDLELIVNKLPLLERKVIYYRYIKDLPFEKVSKKINRAYITTIKKHKSAINKLRQAIQ